MTTDNPIDLRIAHEQLHQLALDSGDLGFEYWYRVSQLLRRAAGMQAEIETLRHELERCRANKRSHIRRHSKPGKKPSAAAQPT